MPYEAALLGSASCNRVGMDWPIKRLNAASGATLSCLEEPNMAYTNPGIEAEN